MQEIGNNFYGVPGNKLGWTETNRWTIGRVEGKNSEGLVHIDRLTSELVL